MPRSNHDFCPACGDVGKVKIIKNIAQVGPYHLGKEIWEKCNFCSLENKTKAKHNNKERTIH